VRPFFFWLPRVLESATMSIPEEIREGRSDSVFEFLVNGNSANSTDEGGVSLLQWCAYYGDVSAMKFLLHKGANLQSPDENLDLSGAAFHGHWRLCQFLLERGADVNRPLGDTGEVPLHCALCTPRRLTHNLVLKVLLAHGANPNCKTKNSVETGCFMRDCLTKGEAPLHRAAAFGDEEAVQLLLDAGAIIDAKDMNGDSPLSWASWYARPAPILRKLCYGNFRIHPDYGAGLEANLVGKPHFSKKA
jgi:uncharacterized protein